MGPIALFDKSFLQSLTVDESVWFDHFFYPVISPVFYVETLADLEKAVRQGRTQEEEVGIIARKIPEMHGKPCVYHGSLVNSNLLGHAVPMTGQIPIMGGRPVRTEGRSGVIFEKAPEEEAFARWQKGEFLEVERLFAKNWRTALNSFDLLGVAAGMIAIGIDTKACRSLSEAKAIACSVVNKNDRLIDLMKFAFVVLNIPRELEIRIMERWKSSGSLPLCDYAPYAAYVLSVEIFFQIALGSHLIGAERPSNRVDITYLFYLPFCMVFLSNDNLHRRCARHFLRKEQSFVWGHDLKPDLKRLDKYYGRLSETEKEMGIDRIAPSPPVEGDFLTSKLWDRHLLSVRVRGDHVIPRDLKKDKELIKEYEKFTKAPTLAPEQVDFDLQDPDVLTIVRSVHKRKGSWWQLPKDLKIRGHHT